MTTTNITTESGTELVLIIEPDTKNTIIGLHIDYAKGIEPKDLMYEMMSIGKIRFPINIWIYYKGQRQEPHAHLEIGELSDFPEGDVSCPCGKDNHWLVKLDEKEAKYV